MKVPLAGDSLQCLPLQGHRHRRTRFDPACGDLRKIENADVAHTRKKFRSMEVALERAGGHKVEAIVIKIALLGDVAITAAMRPFWRYPG
ncbi:MAG TPA: hypothetical protein VGM61_17835 [Pinirhizobacter sp.]